jgi:hypothetical protein
MITTTTKHTPGPWVAYQTGGLLSPWNVRPEDKSIEYVAGTFGRKEKEQEANARLIAAAPELLQSLIKVCDALEKTISSDHQTLSDAREIIEKATTY